ncbi:MAG TPA: GGDEF domain-containing protein [Gemmatimonadaceae bacterium]|nr:GGDEF domain-containing protein [Gemmatimonadaceae bacterium]
MPSPVPPERFFRSSKTLHRSTQELSLQAMELDAALIRDESARFRQALASQQRIRISAAIALAVAAVFVRSGQMIPIGLAVAITGAYVMLVIRMSAVAAKTQFASRGDILPLAVADALAGTALCAIAASGGASETLVWILLAGGIAAPAMAYSFGSRSGIVSFALFGLGYVALELLFIGFGIGRETALTSVASVTLWGAGVWPLMRHLSLVRHRLDTLRTYAKLAEVGDVGTSDLLSKADGSDDFALIARSLETVHARLSDQLGSDPLTGCANRRGLERQLLGVCRLARRREGTVAVAAIDIDHFKVINDSHGHPEGDRVLRQLATIMMNTARDTDTVARLGGDEFVVVLPDSDWRGARIFAERLRTRVAESSFGPPGRAIPVTISVGVAVAEGKADLEPDRLLADADHALYQAKAAGRDRIAVQNGTRNVAS